MESLLQENINGIDSLPNEVLLMIFGYLACKDLRNASAVCKTFHDAINSVEGDSILWKPLTLCWEHELEQMANYVPFRKFTPSLHKVQHMLGTPHQRLQFRILQQQLWRNYLGSKSRLSTYKKKCRYLFSGRCLECEDYFYSAKRKRTFGTRGICDACLPQKNYKD